MHVAENGIAGDIDEEEFSGALPNNKQSNYSRQQNLQFIHGKVQVFLEERGKSFDALSSEDLEHMAGDEADAYVAKFLKLILTVMLESPSMTQQVQKIMTLPPITQEVVGGLMQEVAEFESDLDTGSNEDEHTNHEQSRSTVPPPDAKLDQVFHLEQQYAKVMSQLERRNQEFKDLEAELEKLGKSLARSQETNEALKDEIAERDEQLKKARSMNSDREHSSIKDLETKISQQEENIASKENQLSKLQASFSDLQRENKKHSAARDRASQLQDEIDVMKMELEKQTRKANTADKYMQKLQASQGVEKERDTLRQDLEEARTQLAATAKLRQENAALQQSNDESSRILSQIEQEHDELRMTKKQLRVNYDSLARQVDALNERFAQDQETIADLRERHGPSDRASLSSAMNGGLEGELNKTSKQEDQMKVRIAELEKRNQQLESDVQDIDAKKTTLQRQLNIAMEKSADHSGQVKSLREEILTLQTSLGEVREGHPIEGTETFKRIRDQVNAERQKSLELEKELATAHHNFSAAGGEKKAEGLQQEKTSDGLDLKALNEMIQQASAGKSAGDLSDTIASKLDNMLGGKIEVGRTKLAKQSEVSIERLFVN